MISIRLRRSITGLLACAVFAICTAAKLRAPEQFIRIGDVVTHAEADTSLGPYYVITWQMPGGLSSDGLAQALLELYVDVDAKARGDYRNDAPILEVVAQQQQFNGELGELADVLRASRPVLVGERRRVRLDVTNIVRARLRGASGDQLVVGSLTGLRDGEFRLVTGELGPDVVGRVRIYTRRSVHE
jgi:hypothetical protein